MQHKPSAAANSSTAPSAAARPAPRCRFCGAGLEVSFADLGMTPPSNAYLRPEDLGRAESFFTGPGDRDREQAGGGLVKWRAADFVEVEALWMTTIEGGDASSDESPVAALLNFPLSERSAFFRATPPRRHVLFSGSLFLSPAASPAATPLRGQGAFGSSLEGPPFRPLVPAGPRVGARQQFRSSKSKKELYALQDRSTRLFC